MIQEETRERRKMRTKLNETEVENFIGVIRIVAECTKRPIVVPFLTHNGHKVA